MSASPVSPGRRIAAGAIAGLAGGGVLAQAVDVPIGLAPSLAFGALFGIGFAIVVGPAVLSLGSGISWGQAYGIVLWLLGPLTVWPLLVGEPLGWSVDAAREAFPLLLGLIVGYGAVLGLGYRLLAAGVAWSSDRTGIIRAAIIGGFGGIVGSWLFLRGIDGAQFYPLVAGLVGASSMGIGMGLHYLIGGVIGTSFGVLFRDDVRGAGSGLTWGLMYGLLWWVLGPLTILPLLLGADWPRWELAAARGAAASLLAHLLYGALAGLIYAVGDRVWRVLFVDSDPLNRTREGAGARGLRSAMIGQAGGLIGGLLFTIVMVGIGALPGVARLVGAESTWAGVFVHLLIAITIGSSYGLLFQHQSPSYGAGLASGLTYGLVWWVLGAATLFPIFLGLPVDWSLSTIGALYPSLVGHLFFGAGLGLFFPYLARRYEPIARVRSEPPIADSAPAVWAVTLMIGVMVPLILVP